MRAAVLKAEWSPKSDYKLTPEEENTKKVKIGSRVWRNPRLELEELPVPKLGPYEVLVRVKACGICGSDIHMIETDEEGYMLYPGLTKLPVVPGHELSGVVEEVGEKVTLVKPGDMVMSEEMLWCGRCYYCRSGYLNQCINLEELGFTINGGFEEYIKVDEKYLWKINSLLDAYKTEDAAYEAGSLVEPTAVSYNAIFIRAGGFKPGAYVVVWGAGPIGLAAIHLAKAAGAARVIAFEVIKERMEVARKVGADYVFNPVELSEKGVRPYEKVLEVTDGMGADLHVEAAGAPGKTLPEMERSLAVGGKIAWIGRADREAPLFAEYLQVRWSQIYGSQGHSGNEVFPRVIRLMASGQIDMRKIITARFKLDEIHKAFERSHKRTDAKITIKP